MAASRDRRRTSLTRTGRMLRSVLYLVPLTVPLLVVLAAGPPGVPLPKTTHTLDTGVGMGDASNAFGPTQDGHEVSVCRKFEVPDDGSDDAVTVTSVAVDFTSPAIDLPAGDVIWEIRAVGRNDEPGNVYASGLVPIPSNPPDYPTTQRYSFDLPAGVTLPSGVREFFLCITTRNSNVHIATFSAPGRSLLVWIDGNFLEASGMDIGATVVVDDSSSPVATATVAVTPTIPPTVTPQPVCDERIEQVGNGTGAGNVAYDTNSVTAAFEGLRIEFRINPRGGGDWLEVGDEDLAAGTMYDFNYSDFDVNQFGQSQLLCYPPPKLGGVVAEPLSQAVIFARQPDGREFGQYFQAHSPAEAQQAGETSLLFTTHDPTRYRVNVGLAAAADGTRVRLRALGNGAMELAAPDVIELDHDGASVQINDIDRVWNLGGRTDVMVEVTVLAGAAFPYGSVLDGRGNVPGTSDPTTILPVTTGAPKVVLLEMGRITGLDEFSGSASLFNHSNRPVTVAASFYQRGVPGVAATTSFQLTRRSVISWDDAVGLLFGRTGVVGAVVFEVPGTNPTNLSAIGREFAIYSANGAVTGTAGQALPGLAAADQLMPGETFHFIGLRDRPQPLGRERSHLGVLNLGPADVAMTVLSYADDNVFEGTVTRTIRAGEQLRVNNILSAANPSQDGGLKRIEVTADGPLYVLAYRVNANGDPVTLGWFRR